jgi:hypothetical protein
MPIIFQEVLSRLIVIIVVGNTIIHGILRTFTKTPVPIDIAQTYPDNTITEWDPPDIY